MELTDIITAVTSFVDAYSVYIAAGLVLGLGGFVVTRVIRAGR